MGGAVSDVVKGAGDIVSGGVDIAADMLKPAEKVFEWSTENPLEAAALATGAYFAAPAIAGALGGTGAAAAGATGTGLTAGGTGLGLTGAGTTAYGGLGAGIGSTLGTEAALAGGFGGSTVGGLGRTAGGTALGGVGAGLGASTLAGGAGTAAGAAGSSGLLGGAMNWASANPLQAAGLGLTAAKALGKSSTPSSSTSTTGIDPEMKAAYLRNLEEARGVSASLGQRQFAAFPTYSNEVVNQYMNPYQQQVIDASLGDIERQRQQQQLRDRAAAVQAKAFGGSRQGVAEALTNEAFSRTAANTAAQLRSQGFTQAQQIALQQEEARRQYEQQKLDAIRNLGLERLNISSSALGIPLTNLGGTQTTPLYQNTTASALGGALGGASLGKMIGGTANPEYAGYGAAIGGLLGLA